MPGNFVFAFTHNSFLPHLYLFISRFLHYWGSSLLLLFGMCKHPKNKYFLAYYLLELDAHQMWWVWWWLRMKNKLSYIYPSNRYDSSKNSIFFSGILAVFNFVCAFLFLSALLFSLSSISLSLFLYISSLSTSTSRSISPSFCPSSLSSSFSLFLPLSPPGYHDPLDFHQ